MQTVTAYLLRTPRLGLRQWKIGMKKVREFDHPKIEIGHPLRRHVVYAVE
jgi:hypothetical protein